MELVVDASVLFAVIIGKGKTYNLFFEDRLTLIALPYLIDEFSNNIGELAKICSTSKPVILEIFEILRDCMKLYPLCSYPDNVKSKAEKLAPHGKDVPYSALALYLGCPIWSRERAFKKQDEVKIFSTTELLDMFSK